MSQTLVMQKSFYEKLSKHKNLAVLKSLGIQTPDDFIREIVKKLNEEFAFLEIDSYRFAVSEEEKKEFSLYSAFVEGDNLHFKKIVVFFTPIESKLGDVIIEQSLMPTICTQMQKDIDFLLNESYKKIVLLTSKINRKNAVAVEYNKLQMDVNSLNTMNFDVVSLFPIANLSTDARFNNLTEYLEMSNFLQKKSTTNAQMEYLKKEESTLTGTCKIEQLKGQFIKSFCFRFLTAIFAGGNDYKYDISPITEKLSKLDNQLDNLKEFIDYANIHMVKQSHMVAPIDNDVIESDDLDDIYNIHRKPERGFDGGGRKRFKTQKKIRDRVIKQAGYLCNCNDVKHFYFESIELNNYVEGHHIIPMNRQYEYYFNHSINLDIPNNIVALCPNCHCQIHLGSREARLRMISELFVRNKAQLLEVNSELTLSLLASYYNIGLDLEEEQYWIRTAEEVIAKKQINNK